MPFTLAVRLIKMNKATVVGSHVAAYIAATENGKQIKGIFNERKKRILKESTSLRN